MGKLFGNHKSLSRRAVLCGPLAVPFVATASVAIPPSGVASASNNDALLNLWIERQRLVNESLRLWQRAKEIADSYPCNLELQPVIFWARQFGFLPDQIKCWNEERVEMATKMTKKAAPRVGRTVEEVEAYSRKVARELKQEQARVKEARQKSGYDALMS